MIWAGIGYNGTTSMHICEQSMDSDYYQKVLSECYIPFHQSQYILMQDNATPHVSASTKMFLELHEISILEWPPCSPDCNPIENLQGILVRRLYDGVKCYENVGDLKEAIIAVWDSLEIDEVRKLVMSFPKRLIEVIASGGAASTSYQVRNLMYISFPFSKYESVKNEFRTFFHIRDCQCFFQAGCSRESIWRCHRIWTVTF